MIVDFSRPWIFLLWYIITVGFLFAAYKNKKSIFALITVVYFLFILWLTSKDYYLQDVFVHRFFNFFGLAAGISMYLVIDEIETRRKVITKVFKNRYSKNKEIDTENDEDKEDKG